MSLLALAACGDDGSCTDARKVEDGIAKNAEDVDHISPDGICTLDEDGIARRLMDQAPAIYADLAKAQARAKEYVANCNKLRDLEHECSD